MIPFNRPFCGKDELMYIEEAVRLGHLSGNGMFTSKVQRWFELRYGIKKALMTTSCTDALEMCSLLLDLKHGDEVIVPSYTFVSSALPFVLRGAKVVFADSKSNEPCLDVSNLRNIVNDRTKAIVVVHYAGVSVDLDKVLELAHEFGIVVIEDAAQGIESFYKGKALGSIGHLATFSFHETKNVQCGEGGMLAINDERFLERAEILWEKGTNRSAFFKGEVNKYGWVDLGSSFLPSELNAAFLYAQLLNIDYIQAKRLEIWKSYFELLSDWASCNGISMPVIPSYASNNAHMFYLVCKDISQRDNLIKELRSKGVHAVFHYLSLHKSPYYTKTNATIPSLPNSVKFEECLIRLPLYPGLSSDNLSEIIKALTDA